MYVYGTGPFLTATVDLYTSLSIIIDTLYMYMYTCTLYTYWYFHDIVYRDVSLLGNVLYGRFHYIQVHV